jgi:hypothetical protein
MTNPPQEDWLIYITNCREAQEEFQSCQGKVEMSPCCAK